MVGALGIALINYVGIAFIVDQSINLGVEPKESFFAAHGIALLISLTVPFFMQK